MKRKYPDPAELLRRLRQNWPDAKCSLRFRTPLELLIATILSAQCTDVRVNLVVEPLFRKYKTARKFAEMPREDLETAIQSTGFYHNKAKHIQESCRILVEKYGGKVPPDMDALMHLPGVGRKTANVVLGNGFGIASGVVVDTHVSRLSQRLGLTQEKTPEKIEKDLTHIFPQDTWVELSHLLIHLGRDYCKAQKPNCRDCPMNDICPKIIK